MGKTINLSGVVESMSEWIKSLLAVAGVCAAFYVNNEVSMRILNIRMDTVEQNLQAFISKTEQEQTKRDERDQKIFELLQDIQVRLGVEEQKNKR